MPLIVKQINIRYKGKIGFPIEIRISQSKFFCIYYLPGFEEKIESFFPIDKKLTVKSLSYDELIEIQLWV